MTKDHDNPELKYYRYHEKRITEYTGVTEEDMIQRIKAIMVEMYGGFLDGTGRPGLKAAARRAVQIIAIQDKEAGVSVMRKYKAIFKGVEFDFEADSLYAAKQRAIAHFKPWKRDMGLLSVVLADQPIDPAGL